MHPIRRITVSICTLVALFFVLPASALVTSPVVVFDSFGPGNTYLTSTVWGVEGTATSGGYRGQAEFFTPAISGYLSSVTLATYRQSGSGLSDFFIAQDNGSGPGTILESFLSTANNPNGLLTLNSTSQPLLQAGMKYWLCDEPTDSTTVNGWFENNQNYAPGFAFERSQWSWTTIGPPAPNSGVLRVLVTPVPEPTAFGFLILFGLLGARRFNFKLS